MSQTLLEPEEGKDCPFFKFASGTLAFVCVLLLCFLGYQTVKFLKIYGKSNKCLIMFFCMLNLYVLMKIAYYLEEIFLQTGTCVENNNECVDGVLGGINIEVFVSAMCFNLFNWLYQIYEINEFYNDTKFAKLTLDINLVLWQILLFLFIIVHFSLFCFTDGNKEDYHYWLAYPTSILLMLSSIVFLIVAIYYYQTLKSFSIKKAIYMK